LRIRAGRLSQAGVPASGDAAQLGGGQEQREGVLVVPGVPLERRGPPL
jgi:hypothetical protein